MNKIIEIVKGIISPEQSWSAFAMKIIGLVVVAIIAYIAFQQYKKYQKIFYLPLIKNYF